VAPDAPGMIPNASGAAPTAPGITSSTVGAARYEPELNPTYQDLAVHLQRGSDAGAGAQAARQGQNRLPMSFDAAGLWTQTVDRNAKPAVRTSRHKKWTSRRLDVLSRWLTTSVSRV
jgi:hypothetical protein